MKVFESVPVSRLTTFKHQGTVSLLTVCESRSDVERFFSEQDQWVLLGKGSNSLLGPSVLQRPFVQVGAEISELRVEEGVLVASAGTSVSQLVLFSQKMGLSGFEFMAGVPATVGGMVAMNFGCWDIEVEDRLMYVDVYIPGQGFERLSNEDCQFAYRSSVFQQQPWVVVEVGFSVTEASSEWIKETVHRQVQQRLEKQPLRGNTFGSVFKNPGEFFAAELIEKSGLKGMEKNGVKISEQHANFMENVSDASFEAVTDMISFIQDRVYESFKVQLLTEVCIFS